MRNSRTKCNLYFTKTYNETTLYDLSGNGYDGTFKGAKVQKDENGNLGIYFDGKDDFVDVVDLPASINWESGFIVEFEAMWKAFSTYSRILDFGNGPESDNIFVTNYAANASLSLGTRYGKRGSDENYGAFSQAAVPVVSIDKDKKNFYKLIVKKEENNIIIDIYKKSNLSGTITYDVTQTGNIVKNILRTENYLGKSNWTADGYFFGYIYSLKITDSKNNIILWYDF